jgi:hypothetical protein
VLSAVILRIDVEAAESIPMLSGRRHMVTGGFTPPSAVAIIADMAG